MLFRPALPLLLATFLGLVVLCTAAPARVPHYTEAHTYHLHSELLLENPLRMFTDPLPLPLEPSSLPEQHDNIKTQSADDSLDDLRKTIKDIMKCKHVPGLGVGVVYKGKVVFSEGFGIANATSNEPVSDDSIFGIASMSKAFTSAGLGILQDRGVLTFNDLVSDHIPGFAMKDLTASSIVTIQDLISHRTGLPRHDTSLFNWKGSETRAEKVSDIRFLSPTYQIREKWQYNNWMVLAAGYLAGYTQNQTWDGTFVYLSFSVCLCCCLSLLPLLLIHISYLPRVS